MNSSLHEHLLQRNVDFSVHTVHLTTNAATFMMYNLSGQLTGYQTYRPNNVKLGQNFVHGKYYTYKTPTCLSIFGIETLTMLHKVVFITEGIFDATPFTKRGCAALALLTNAPNTSLLNFLSCLPQKLILIADNDKGGDILRKKLKHLVAKSIKPTLKDTGDMSDDHINNLIKQFCL
jgi:hypothetical protein